MKCSRPGKFHACVACAAVAMSIAIPARAAPPVFESMLGMRTLDARTEQPVEGAVVVVSEHYYWTALHSSGTTCFRAVAKRLESRGESEILRLPAVDPVTSAMVIDETRHVEVFAYRAGYCVAQPYASAEQAGFVKWGNKGKSSGSWGKVETPQFGTAIVLRLKPSNDPPEHRLRYLARVAAQISRHCRDLGDAYLQPLRSAMLVEADGLASDPVANLLAARVREAFQINPGHKYLRSVLHAAAAKGDVPGMRRMLGWARTDPFLAGTYCPPNESTCMIPVRTPDEMPRERAFDINERDENGFSALMAAAKAMQPATVRALIESGADADVLSSPGGYGALDLVLSRARDDVKEGGAEGFEGHLLRMIDLLKSANPPPTLHPVYHAQLSDPSRWKLGPRLQPFWLEVRARVATLAPRAAIEAACPIEEPARLSLQLGEDKPAAR
jgi:Ankyrin repeat